MNHLGHRIRPALAGQPPPVNPAPAARGLTPRLPAPPEVAAARRAMCGDCARNVAGRCKLCKSCGTTGDIVQKTGAALERCPENKWLPVIVSQK